MPTLSQYLTTTQRLLHDANNNYWSQAELIDYINDGRFRVVADTGCNRTLQTTWLSQGMETYAYGSVTGVNITAGGSGFADGTYALGLTGGDGTSAAGTYTCSGGAVVSAIITTQGSGYTNTAPTVSFPSGGGSSATGVAGILSANTFDTLNITLLWGNMRIPMGYQPYTEFNLKMRVWQSFQSRPVMHSCYGQQTVYVGPIPDQTYQVEFDTVVAPGALTNLAASDTISIPFTDPVPYYAAYFAKYKEQSYDEATRFLEEYNRRIGMAVRSAATRRIPYPYGRG